MSTQLYALMIGSQIMSKALKKLRKAVEKIREEYLKLHETATSELLIYLFLVCQFLPLLGIARIYL